MSNWSLSRQEKWEVHHHRQQLDGCCPCGERANPHVFDSLQLLQLVDIIKTRDWEVHHMDGNRMVAIHVVDVPVLSS